MRVTETEAEQQKITDELKGTLGVLRKDHRFYPACSWHLQVLSNLTRYFTNCLCSLLSSQAQ